MIEEFYATEAEYESYGPNWEYQTEQQEGRQRPHPSRRPNLHLCNDAMNRFIDPGDVLTWRSGGYYSDFMSFGLVTKVDAENGKIRVRNHNGTMITIWKTFTTVIIAKQGDYSLITPGYKEKLGIEDF